MKPHVRIELLSAPESDADIHIQCRNGQYTVNVTGTGREFVVDLDERNMQSNAALKWIGAVLRVVETDRRQA